MTVPLPLGYSVHNFHFLSISQLNILEPELIFKYGQWKDVFLVFFDILIHIFAINMIYLFSFDLPAVMLFCSKQNINNS